MKDKTFIFFGIILFVIMPVVTYFKELKEPKLPPQLLTMGMIAWAIYTSLLLSIVIAYFIAKRGNKKAHSYIKYFSGR
jgi:tryptophan-rich sensory protein